MKIGEKSPEYISRTERAHARDNTDQQRQDQGQPAAPHQSPQIGRQPIRAPGPNPSDQQDEQIDLPDAQKSLGNSFDVLHMTELAHREYRCTIAELQIVQV